MKTSLQPGLSETRRITIDKDRTITFMGDEGRVYGTPYFVLDIEELCRDLLLKHSDKGEDSVGMDISLRHTAPTPLGMTAEITVTVAKVEGRKVSFDVSAKDDIEAIGTGTHTRFVADVDKVQQRVMAKAAKKAV
jgi:predicted thioesterase